MSTRTPAPALTAEELAVVARFEAAPYPAEVTEAHLESVRAVMAPSAPAPQGNGHDCSLVHPGTVCSAGGGIR